MHPFRGQSSAQSSAKLRSILGDDAKGYASGGRVKSGKNAKTHINIMVAPHPSAPPAAPAAPPMPPPGAAAAPPPPVPMGGLPGPRPMPAPLPAGAMGMPVANAMPMRKRGGRVRKREDGGSVGAGQNQTAAPRPDQNRSLAEQNKPYRNRGGRARHRATGGRTGGGMTPVKAESIKAGTKVSHTGSKVLEPMYDKPPALTRRNGGRTYPKMKYGSESGQGRLEKAAMQKRSYP